jgi:hypothetical protein
LRHFFFVGNALCHPSVLIRRRCYDTVGLYNPALAQIPDLDMWMRLLRHFDIHLIEEPIVGFRILKAGQNASAGRPDSIARVQWEWLKVLSNYLDLDSDLLADVFPELPGESASPPVNWFLAQLAFSTGKPPYILFGLDIMYRLVADLDEPDLYREFIRYSGAYDIFDVLSKMPASQQ